MRSFLSCAFVIALILPLQSIAKGGACESIPDLKGYDLTGCKCGNAIARLPIIAPNNMSLIAACSFENFKAEGGWSYWIGGYYFKGEIVISGVLHREYDNAFSGDYISFSSNEKIKYSEFGSSINSMRFYEDPVDVKKLNPPLPDSTQCWSAPVQIKVNLLYVLAGHGTDEEGTFPKKFEILKIGKRKPCPQ